MYIGVGVAVLYGMHKLEGDWFDRIGLGIFLVSLITFTLMLFSPSIIESRVYLKVVSFSVRPSLYFVIGIVWLMDYSIRTNERYMKVLLVLGWVLALIVWLFMVKVDPPVMVLVGFTVLGMLAYHYGSVKVFFVFMGGMIGTFGLVLFYAPHRIRRIQSWWELIISGESFAMPTGLDLIVSKMHEGIFVYNDWGGIALMIVSALFVWLIIVLWRVESFFAKGISMVFLVDILFHIINFFRLTPLKPPALFIIEYGLSITLVTFLMMGMVWLSDKNKT